MAALAPELVALFTRRNAAAYLPISAEVLAILAWFVPLSFANGLIQYVLIAIGRQSAITRAFLVGAAFNLAANLVAIPAASNLLGRPQLGLHAAPRRASWPSAAPRRCTACLGHALALPSAQMRSLPRVLPPRPKPISV